MSIFETLTSMNLAPDTKVSLSYSEGTDVLHYNETEIETALRETDVVSTLADLVATPGLSVTTQYGGDVLESLRDDGLLEDYERGSFSFSEYITETINDNFYDIDLIEYTTEKYDHKRGFTTLSAEVQVTLENFVEAQPFLVGWEVSVKTEKGTLVLG